MRPGFYDRNGAAQAANGVSFTIHSMGATGCTLLLFRPKEQEPFAKIRYPETYCIGSTYSMLVFGLNIEEFEYAFQLDGPYDEKKGLRFHKDNILLDPYARAVDRAGDELGRAPGRWKRLCIPCPGSGK